MSKAVEVYKTKVSFVEAILYDGTNAKECIDLICKGGMVSRSCGYAFDEYGRPCPDPLAIRKHANPGEWIVRCSSTGRSFRMTSEEFFRDYEAKGDSQC